MHLLQWRGTRWDLYLGWNSCTSWHYNMQLCCPNISQRGAYAQVVHSDLKSQNVLLTRNWEIAKIADAGVARYRQHVDVHGNEGVPSTSPRLVLTTTGHTSQHHIERNQTSWPSKCIQ